MDNHLLKGRLCERVFGCAPIFDLIFSSLSPLAFVRLAQTCRVLHLAAANFKSRAFNINIHFSRYFDDPIAFRSLQAKTNSLVSGSNVLQFLDRTFYSEADFDLYVHPGHSSEVAAFLVEAEGYHYVPRATQDQDWKFATNSTSWDGTVQRVSQDTQHGYPLKRIREVWTFEKESMKQERLKIQIIEATSCPVDAILEFHSTVVMNFISADAAYSFYPLATFEERSSLATSTVYTTPASAIQKYIRRGWRFYYVPTPDQMLRPKAPFMLNRPRWVGDKYTWVLPLDQTGVKPRPPLGPASAPLAFDPSRMNGWTMKDASQGVRCHVYAVQMKIFRYNYVVPDEDKWFEIQVWAHQQALMQSYFHDDDKSDWVWFDADLPFFLESS